MHYFHYLVMVEHNLICFEVSQIIFSSLVKIIIFSSLVKIIIISSLPWILHKQLSSPNTHQTASWVHFDSFLYRCLWNVQCMMRCLFAYFTQEKWAVPFKFPVKVFIHGLYKIFLHFWIMTFSYFFGSSSLHDFLFYLKIW